MVVKVDQTVSLITLTSQDFYVAHLGTSLLKGRASRDHTPKDEPLTGLPSTQLGEGNDKHSSILAWRIPWTEGPAAYRPRGHKGRWEGDRDGEHM